jgi:high-affinity nickel-transport protein
MYNFNINTAGFVIVGMFIATWAGAMAIWRFGRIEEKWTARLNKGQNEAQELASAAD